LPSQAGNDEESQCKRKMLQQLASLVFWSVENTVDLDDIVVEQALNLEHSPRRIWRLTPELCLYLAHQRREAVQIGYVDRDTDAILQGRPLRVCNQFQVQEGLTNTSLVTVHQFFAGRIDALHPCNKDEVPRPRPDAPSVAPGTDCARGIERFYAIGRLRPG
jgi:hypothetical protein